MYLGHYAFDGDPDDLTAGYQRMVAAFGSDSLELHVAVRRPDGLDVYDTCPSEEVFAAFTTSAEFGATLAAAGLPLPRVTGCGQVINVVDRRSP
jgi:hypothetical protein